MSIFGNLAARRCSSPAEVSMPGAITPPRYSPPFEMTSNVVAVPKSTITSGPLYLLNPATALQSLSAPTDGGSSTSTLIPRGRDDETTIGSTPKYFFDIRCMTSVRFGTTDEIPTAEIFFTAMRASSQNVRTSAPNSSSVRDTKLVTRQSPRSFFLS